MVIMRREDVTGVVSAPLYFGYYVKEFIIIEKLIFDVYLYALHVLYCLRRYPDDGLVHHFLSVSLEEFDGSRPGQQKAGVGALACFLKL